MAISYTDQFLEEMDNDVGYIEACLKTLEQKINEAANTKKKKLVELEDYIISRFEYLASRIVDLKETIDSYSDGIFIYDEDIESFNDIKIRYNKCVDDYEKFYQLARKLLDTSLYVPAKRNIKQLEL